MAESSIEKELLVAAEKNDITRCKIILQEAKGGGAFNIDCLDEAGTTPLQIAAYKGNLELCKLLIAHGAEVNHHEHKHGYTALMFAALSGKVEVVRLLLEYGAKTYVTNSVNRTASQMAAFVGYHHVVAAINNFLPRYMLVDFTKMRGLETEPKLPPDCLADFYHFVNQLSVHPVRLALTLRERVVLLENEKKMTSLLELLCERFMKLKDETNDRLAFKMHIYAEVIREIVRPEGEKIDSKSAATLSRAELTEKVDAFTRRMLTSRESDGYFLALEKFARRIIQHFPYLESELLQTVVRQLAPHRCGDANAPSALNTLNSAVFTQFFMRNEEATCTTCGDVLPVREDDDSQQKVPTSQAGAEEPSKKGTPNADTDRKLRKCSACRVTQYCSVACQRAHWFTHKRSCAALRAIRERNEEELREAERVRARAQLLAQKAAQSSDTLAMVEPDAAGTKDTNGTTSAKEAEQHGPEST